MAWFKYEKAVCAYLALNTESYTLIHLVLVVTGPLVQTKGDVSFVLD